MIPFGLFTRVILDSGIVRIDFNNVTWVDNGDGTWSYTIPRTVHLSGSYPKTILIDDTTRKINLVTKEYINDQVKLTALSPYSNFACYFMGDETEVGGSDIVTFPMNLYTNKLINNATAFSPTTTSNFIASGVGKMIGDSTTQITPDWIDISSNLPDKIKEVVFGSFHSVVLLENGKIYGVGQSNKYQITGVTNDHLKWTDMELDNVVKVAAAGENTIALLSNGTVRIRGVNSSGEHGVGDTKLKTGWSTPPISNVTDIKGSWSTIYIKSGGEWYGTGWDWGQFGTAYSSTSAAYYNKFTKVNPLSIAGFTDTNVVGFYVTGSNHTFSVTDQGNVYCAGSINKGKRYVKVTGIPTDVQINNISATDKGAIASTTDGRVFMAGDIGNQHIITPSLLEWVEITDDIGKQQYVTRSANGTFIYDGVTVKYCGDNANNITGQKDVLVYPDFTEI